MSEQSTILAQMMIGKIIPRATSKTHNIRECSKPLTCHQLQGAEGGEALEEGLALSPGDCSAYSMGRIRDTQQGRAKSRSKSRRRSLKSKRGRISQSRSCILLHAIRHISLNMWATSNPRRWLLRRVILRLLGLVTTTNTGAYLGSQSAARRASPSATTARYSRGVRSSHSQ
jgi:hypothetical protein